MSIDYLRVLPRDLFNEANLLKCLGRLWILLEYGGHHQARFTNDSCNRFDITQDPDDGSIHAAGVSFAVGHREYRLWRPVNSREPWPLYAAPLSNDEEDWQEDVEVFDKDGNLSAAMKQLIGWQE